eukprot:8029624-Alexandrium_andersonii.AAC.1
MHSNSTPALPCPAVSPNPVVVSKYWDPPRVTALEDSAGRSSHWPASQPAQLALPAPSTAVTPAAAADPWN